MAVEEYVIYQGSSFDPLDPHLVYGWDPNPGGNPYYITVTQSDIISDDVNVNKVGTYHVTYIVKNKVGVASDPFTMTVKVVAPRITKYDAIAAIDKAAMNKINEICSSPFTSSSPLTEEEKKTLIDQVSQAANIAKSAINNAQTEKEIEDAEATGLDKIEEITVPAESPVKAAAKNAVAKVADAKEHEIFSSGLSNEEKDALKKLVTEAQTAADSAIDSAKINAGVTQAQEEGITSINKIIVPTASNKEKAITDLTTNHVETNAKNKNSKQTVVLGSAHAKSNTTAHHNGVVSKNATLPQTGKKNSNLTLVNAALLGLAGVLSLFGLGDKRTKNN
jgi:LPXTG-motif cell wall-anchored protein